MTKKIDELDQSLGCEEQQGSKIDRDTTGSDVLTTLQISKQNEQNKTIAQLPSLDGLSDIQKAFVEMFDMLLKKNEFDNAFDVAAKGKLPREFYLYAITYYIEDFKQDCDDEYKKRSINKFHDYYLKKEFREFLEKHILPANIFTKEQLIVFFSTMLQEKDPKDQNQVLFDMWWMFKEKEFMEKYYDSDFIKTYLKQLLISEELSWCQDILESMQKNAIEIPEEEKILFMKKNIAHAITTEDGRKDKCVNGIITLAKKLGYTLDESEKKSLLKELIYDLNIKEILIYLDEFGDKQLRREIFMAMADRGAYLYGISEILWPKNKETELFSWEEIQSLCEEILKKGHIELLLQIISFSEKELDIQALVDKAIGLGYMYDAQKIATFGELPIPESPEANREEIKKSITIIFKLVIPYIAHAPSWDKYNSFFRATSELKNRNFFPERMQEKRNDKLLRKMYYPKEEKMFEEFIHTSIDTKESLESYKRVLEILRAYIPLVAIVKSDEKIKHKGILSIYRGPVVFNDSVIVNQIRQYYIGGDEKFGCAEFLQYKSPTDCPACKKTQEGIYDVRISHLITKQRKDRVYGISEETLNEKILEIFTGEERKSICMMDAMIKKLGI